MISFKSIPVDMRTPGTAIEFDSSRAGGSQALPNRILVIGQKLAAGSAAALSLETMANPDSGSMPFGRGSMLDRMVRAAKAADAYTPLDAIALTDKADGTAATGTLTVTGPASAAGQVTLMIAGQRVAIPVAASATPQDIATAIGAKVNGNADLPITASVESAVVTLTARHKGTCGNDIDVRHSHYSGEQLPAGVGVAIVAMAGGAGDPDYSAAIAKMGDIAYRTVIIGTASAATVADLLAELQSRWGPLRMIETFGYAAIAGTQGEAAAFGAALNSQLIGVVATNDSPTPPWEFAAVWGTVCGYYSYIDPARPLQTLRLPGVKAPRKGAEFTRAERELLLRDGISTWTVGADGSAAIERAITTYQLNDAGLEDTAFLDVETVTTLAYIRQSLRARITSKFPRHSVADDDTNFAAGQAIVTPKIVKAEIIALALEDWEPKGLVENIAQLKRDLIVERAADDPNRLNALVPPNLVNQFRQFAAQVQFRL